MNLLEGTCDNDVKDVTSKPGVTMFFVLLHGMLIGLVSGFGSSSFAVIEDGRVSLLSLIGLLGGLKGIGDGALSSIRSCSTLSLGPVSSGFFRVDWLINIFLSLLISRFYVFF